VTVILTGVTGPIGERLVPRLTAAGPEVDGMARRQSRQAMLGARGAVPVVADALDPDRGAAVVARARFAISKREPLETKET
jgi:nucleoside-diphosphate-sugar epimerase